MIKLIDLLNEGKYKADGKYLEFPDGGVTSIPGPYDRDAVVFRSSDNGHSLVYDDGKGIYLYGDRYDKRFKNIAALAKWLNKNNYEYVGIDNR